MRRVRHEHILSTRVKHLTGINTACFQRYDQPIVFTAAVIKLDVVVVEVFLYSEGCESELYDLKTCIS